MKKNIPPTKAIIHIALLSGLALISSNAFAEWTKDKTRLDEKPTHEQCVQEISTHRNWDARAGENYNFHLNSVQDVRRMITQRGMGACSPHYLYGGVLLSGGSDYYGNPKKLLGLACYLDSDKKQTIALLEQYRREAKIAYNSPGVTKILDDLETKCVDFWLANMPAAVALQKEERLALQRKQERKRKAARLAREQAAIDKRRKKEFQRALNVPDDASTYMVWKKTDKKIKSTSNYNDKMLNNINMIAWDKTYQLLDKKMNAAKPEKPRYSEPTIEKGEFEKTRDFEARKTKEISKAKKEYEIQLANYEKSLSDRKQAYTDAINNKEALFKISLLKLFPYLLADPEISSVAYDADNEAFKITVSSNTIENYSVQGLLPVPIAKAAETKILLENGDSYVVYTMPEFQIKAQRIVIKTPEKVYVTANVSDRLGDFKFTEQAANEYRPKYERAMKKEKVEKMRAQAAEKERERKREIAYQRRMAQERKERMEKYGHPGPFVEVGATVCFDVRSMYKAMAILRANNPYVPMPEDCILSTPQMMPVKSVRSMSAGISQVIVKKTGVSVYTTTTSIID